MVENIIEDILNKYFDGENEYYSKYREENDESYYIKDEISKTLSKMGINFKLEITDAFESCRYDCSVLSVAYIEPNNNCDSLRLKTALLEIM